MTETNRAKNVPWILALCAVALLALFSRGCGLGYYDGFGFRGPWFGAVTQLFGLWWVLSAGLAIWVGVDANRRGNNGWLWGGLTFLTGLVGLLVYLLLEKDIKIARRGVDDQPGEVPGATVSSSADDNAEPLVACHACGAALSAQFRHCPYCGRGCQDRHCSCGRELQPDWKACPDCGNPVS